MKTDSNLTIYKASAGSGKTFRLAVRYITMLVRNPQSYSTILAVTFTNKATAEMKQRILSQLYGIGHRLESSQGYYNEIRKAIPTYTEDTIRHNATLALDSILQDYGHFRVETIDSFFQGILRGLARELQLGNGLSIELDTGKVISDAVDDFLANLDPDPKSQDRRNVQRFIMGKIENDSNWNIDVSLKKFSKELFSEIFMQKGEDLKRILENPDAIRDYQENLTSARDAVLPGMQKEVIGIGLEIQAAMTAAGHSTDDFSSHIKTAIQRIISGEILNKELSDTMLAACSNPSKFFTKDTLKAYPSLLALAEREFCHRLDRVREIHEEYSFYAHSYGAALQYLYELSLLLSVRSRIDAQNREQGRFVLADTPKMLGDLKQGDTSFVFEKTGSFTDHVMIDEFQDTSVLQWRNLYLLLLECLSRGRECLVVGDVKQSIYRWRNSDWNILNTGIEEKLGQYCRIETMSDNYRSHNAVIDFNNRLFPQAEKAVQEYVRSLTGSTFPALDKAYADVCQNCRKDSAQGYVSASIISTKLKGQELDDDICRRISDSIDSLTAAGVLQSDIAILCRKTDEISRIASWFATNRSDCRMISSEAFRLDSSVSVRILIGALRWIAEHSDRVSLATMLWEWKTAVMQSELVIQDISSDEMEKYLPEQLAGKWEMLRQMPLYELVEKLYVDLDLGKVKGEDGYIFTFFDTVSDWLKHNPGDIQVFLTDWDDKLHKNAIPSTDTDGIRLMTIHKSKGLEFHTVIVPFCDWAVTKQGDKLWVRPEQTPFDRIPLLPVGFNEKLHTSVFEKEYAGEVGQQAVDNLNLLYVAFTRAESNLIVFASRHNSKGNSTCNVLENSLKAAFDCESGEDGITYTSGTICPHREKELKASDNPFDCVVETEDIAMCSLPPNAQFRQSGESVRFTRSAGDPEDRQEDYIKRGNLLHSLFSTIRTESDIDTQVDSLFGQGIIDSRAQADRLKADIRDHIEKSGVRDWFDGKYRLFNETSILFRDNGVMQTRRPDRVMIMPDGRAVVVDFKFGTEREEYHHQVQEYMDLLRKMGFENVEGHIWYVYKNKLTQI